ncbi:hypothetical protein T492DRAFT_871376 [Pavlovales sp. CCMP2436]|nr:hypothetical protein T492DRAFT_871376 [Pavlovales sp. CCMP2436]
MSRARAPVPRLTYTGIDFTGSPQENANRLKPTARKPKPASKLSQPAPGPAAFAAPAGPAASAAPPLIAVVALDLSSPDERDITGSGRRVRRPPGPQPTAAPKVPVARKLKPKQPAAANSQKRPPVMPGEATFKKVKVSAASVDARRSEELPASAALNEAAPEAVTAPPPPAPAFAPPSPALRKGVTYGEYPWGPVGPRAM